METVNTRVFESSLSRSLLFHLFLLLVAYFYATHAPKLDLQSEPVEVTLEDLKKDKTVRKTIVQKSLGEESREAKKNSYLSDATRVVQEERSAQSPGELKTPPMMPQAQAIQKSPRLALSDFGVKISPKNQAKNKVEYNQQRNWAQSQMGEVMKGGQYIAGMKEGEVSALNTKEFVFYSYFERVRQQLDQAWQPLLRLNVLRLTKAGRHLASNADYTTRTLVTLNQKGEILRVQLLEESGTFDLDQAALDALNKAGPYPNPPKGLVDSTGSVEIRWDFILRT
jgi:protein TonB